MFLSVAIGSGSLTHFGQRFCCLVKFFFTLVVELHVCFISMLLVYVVLDGGKLGLLEVLCCPLLEDLLFEVFAVRQLLL